MNRHSGAAAVVLVAAFAIAGLPQLTDPVTAQTPAAKQIPRMPDGKPNLQGIWQVRNRAAYGLEYHAASYGILPGKSVLTDGGKIPYTPAALKKRNENFDKAGCFGLAGSLPIRWHTRVLLTPSGLSPRRAST